MFISTPLLQALADTTELYIDGTIRTVPSLFYQLVTIHARSFNHVGIKSVTSNITS